MIWQLSHRADRFSALIADRHYSRQKPGTPQFAPTGSCVVFKALTDTGRAYWVTSAPLAEWVKHAWAGAWICSAFRNEGAGRASDMIVEAVAATLAHYGTPPRLGYGHLHQSKEGPPDHSSRPRGLWLDIPQSGLRRMRRDQGRTTRIATSARRHASAREGARHAA